ncbi:MAG: tripartite tricarboxylate transporter permease [Haloferacaceae archaeon]
MLQVGILEAFRIAVVTVSDPVNFFLIVLGTLLGMIFGILPGLGGTVALALLIPLTFGMDPLVAFMLLAASKGGSNFGGSITAILINTPGTAPNAATLIDGHPMAKKGKAGEALGASAGASAFGAIFGIVILALSIPVMLIIILAFGPPEIFWLGVWGLTVIAIVVKGRVLTGLISAGFGLLFSMHGINTITAATRWTYGLVPMADGFKLVPSLIGLFAIAEMISLVAKGRTIADTDAVEVHGGQWDGLRAVFTHKWIFLRSAVIGTIIGAIPGVGGSAANYIAYFQAVQTSKNPESFGTGDVRGVIASEASNDAKDGGAFLPTLGLGVPGSASMAVLLGAFLLHGIRPGPLLFENHLDVVTVIIVSLLISNVLTSSIGLVIAEHLTKITRIDIRYVAPVVISIAFFGSYALNNNVFDIFLTLLFGVVGFFMIKMNVSRVPLILGMVLGPIVEENFFRSLQVSSGSYAVFVRSPLAIMLLLLVLLSLFLPYIKLALRNREVSFL